MAEQGRGIAGLWKRWAGHREEVQVPVPCLPLVADNGVEQVAALYLDHLQKMVPGGGIFAAKDVAASFAAFADQRNLPRLPWQRIAAAIRKQTRQTIKTKSIRGRNICVFVVPAAAVAAPHVPECGPRETAVAPARVAA